MFLKVFYYFILIFLVSGSSPAFSSPACEDSFASTQRSLLSPHIPSSPHRREPLPPGPGLESYQHLLTRLAQSNLEVTSLTSRQVKALETYHQVVQGEAGQDGTFARVGNYTFFQRRRIIRFLREVFSPEQVTTLVENGVVEINRPSDVQTIKRVSRHLKKGRKVFIQVANNKVLRVSETLEETNSGWLVEAERISKKSGQIVKEQVFLIKGGVKAPPLLEASQAKLKSQAKPIGISEKTSRGFIIDTYVKEGDGITYKTIKGNKVFFPFEKAIENGLLPRNPTAQDYQKLELLLDSYISDNFKELVQTSKDMGSSLASSAFIYAHLNPLLQRSFIIGEPEFRLASPELESVFEAAQSTRKRIDSGELNVPSFSSREEELAGQGYKSNYTEGIDYINKWIAVRRLFRKLRVNPHTTHIEYFANQVPRHIAHIRRGLEDHYSPKEESHSSKTEQLQKLDKLEEEAKKAISEERVTYNWWIEFNFGLAYIMSGRTLNRHSINWVDSHLFPMRMAMPVIQKSKGLGIITFNRAGLEGLYPVGLINRQSLDVHGSLDAALFFAHDLQHPMFGGNKLYMEYSFGHLLFHRRLLNNIENLPIEQRKKAEAIYFLMTHEYQIKNISYSDRTLQEVREEVFTMIQNNDAELFKLPDSPAQKKQKIEGLTDIFMEVYEQALQHQLL